MPTALLSVSDKAGIAEFATSLQKLGWELVSTGGTAAALRGAGLTVKDVSEVTGFPEILDGRVKTLHPAIHAALLARRDRADHLATIAEHGISPISLVAVNLYPFAATAAREGVTADDVIENIDIGGPSMLRSAAKNFAAVTVIVDPADYPRVIAGLEADDDDLDLRRLLAEKVFAHTAAYDAAIARWFACERAEEFPDRQTMVLDRHQTLRYGENPGQRAAFYVERGTRGLAALVQRGGKELSFNNLLDLEGALLATDQFDGETCCAIVKHTTPCGLAVGDSALRGGVESFRGMHRRSGIQPRSNRHSWSEEKPASVGRPRCMEGSGARLQARPWRIPGAGQGEAVAGDGRVDGGDDSIAD